MPAMQFVLMLAYTGNKAGVNYLFMPEDTFIRIHHGTIINKLFVEKYLRGDGGQVLMRNGSILDVSKKKNRIFIHHGTLTASVLQDPALNKY